MAPLSDYVDPLEDDEDVPMPGEFVDDLLAAAKAAADSIDSRARARLRSSGHGWTWCRLGRGAALRLIEAVEAYDAACAAADRRGDR